MAWTAEFLDMIAGTEGLRIAPLREDSTTFGTPTYIWAVVVEERLFVRAYSGAGSSWFRAALREGAGCIQVARQVFDMRFAPVDEGLTHAIDAAYRSKYPTSRYLAPMISERARGACVEVLPAGDT